MKLMIYVDIMQSMLVEFVQCYCTSLQDMVILSNLPTLNWSYSIRSLMSYVDFSHGIDPLWAYNAQSISIEFVQCHCTSLQDMVMLRGKSGRRWPVKCSLVSAPAGAFRGAFTEGWKLFVEDNELQVGDTLIFNLLGEASFFIVRIPTISPQSISPEHTLAVRCDESEPLAYTENSLLEDEMVEPPHLEAQYAQFAMTLPLTSSLSSPYPYLVSSCLSGAQFLTCYGRLILCSSS